MSRTPATITQADIARAIRAAKQAGAGPVNLIFAGGTAIRIDLEGDKPNIGIEPRRGSRL